MHVGLTEGSVVCEGTLTGSGPCERRKWVPEAFHQLKKRTTLREQSHNFRGQKGEVERGTWSQQPPKTIQAPHCSIPSVQAWSGEPAVRSTLQMSLTAALTTRRADNQRKREVTILVQPNCNLSYFVGKKACLPPGQPTVA